ncbi:FAD-dependent oxidoreductase [Rossellomorea aquimaris]|uniref:FAD-dependent oxidoreductase n=1 Tax=Rossellomorea aquimaris TaxID=189382 RepID=A0A5D4TMY7_9BACI|nr:FAD-dependent oxidoreductase [Rossellomorea aquimaris]TYS76188.1 FAD-dependent oxidoreductase [Rossellomorea aquimaris]TYS82623.1 FAD-dependent oxidoreductase [Rossellomorea aquimaris]
MDKQHQNAFSETPEPYWRETTKLPLFKKLDKNIKVDVTVVGGGIAGITTAYLLAKGGKKVALIEADHLLNGTTGHTTAKISAQHGLIYDELIQHFGVEFARKYYLSQTKALQFIKDTISSENIDCHFTEEDSYVYATTDQYATKIEKEYEAYQKLEIQGELIEKLPIDLSIKNAVVMKDQAQFHPLKYLKALIDSYTGLGGQIFEGTAAKTINEGDSTQVVTADGYHLDSEHVVICSHFPFYDGMGFYFTKMYAERSYILGVKAKKDYPGGMYLSAEDPTRSLRSQEDENGENLILIGGDNHKTGQGKDTLDHYKALKVFGEEVLGIEEIRYRWSAQDLITLDKVPYIGKLTEKHPSIFVATGFKKWGMSSGTLAGQILSEQILGNHHIYADVYTPSRFVADPSIKHFFKENINVAGQLIKGKLQIPTKKVQELQKGEGDVVNLNGRRCGGYRDEAGKLHVVDTTCTHLGCETEWNHGDHTWDCPCHGSRFSIDGEVIEGPAKKPLTRFEVTD